MVHDYSFFGSTADFVIKKGTFRVLKGKVFICYQRENLYAC
jgi:hypothetical protein